MQKIPPPGSDPNDPNKQPPIPCATSPVELNPDDGPSILCARILAIIAAGDEAGDSAEFTLEKIKVTAENPYAVRPTRGLTAQSDCGL